MRVKRLVAPGQWEEVTVSYKLGDGRSAPSLAQQVMEGYKRAEAKGQRINGKAENIKRIWSN